MLALLSNIKEKPALASDSIQFVGYIPVSTGSRIHRRNQVELVRLMKEIISLEKKLIVLFGEK